MSDRTDLQRTAHARLAALLDDGSLVRLDDGATGVVAGHGTVDGRVVCVFCQDPTAPSPGDERRSATDVVAAVLDLALMIGAPVIGIHDPAPSDGAPPADFVDGTVLRRSAHACGVVPQIAVVLGSMTGAAASAPALADFVVMVQDSSHLLACTPEEIATVTGEQVTLEELGGARTHSTVSGLAHHLATDEDDAWRLVRQVLSYLPSNNLDGPVIEPPVPDAELAADDTDLCLDHLVPDSPGVPFDITVAVRAVTDDGDMLQVHEHFAPGVVTALARVDGHPVGIVADQPMSPGGRLDMDAAEKAARFVRGCDEFNLPVVTFVDSADFLPAATQERGGILRRVAGLVHAYAEATVPLVTITTRSATAPGRWDPAVRDLGADLALVWPTAQPGRRDVRIAASDSREQLIRGLRVLRTKRVTAAPRKHSGGPR